MRIPQISRIPCMLRPLPRVALKLGQELGVEGGHGLILTSDKDKGSVIIYLHIMNHDPKQAIADLQVILSNPSKKIGFLFGAGISLKDESEKPLIPGVQELTDTIISTFSPGIEKDAIQKMKIEIGEKKFNIESLLTKITEKEVAAGNEKLCGMTQLELKGLRKKIEDQIKTIVSVHKSNFSTRDLAHYKFAQWIKNADRNSSVEAYWKQCNTCGRILPGRAFSGHAGWGPLEKQMECRSCKAVINTNLNPKRTKEQLHESSARRGTVR